MIRIGLEKATEKVLTRIGEVQNVGPLFQITINGINTDEPNSSLVKAVLSLFTQFSTLTYPQLRNWRFYVALPKLQDLGDAKVKEALKKIEQTVERNGGKSEPDPAPKKATTADTKNVPKKSLTSVTTKPERGMAKQSQGQSSSGQTPVKRQREDDSDNARVSKKVAVGTGTKSNPTSQAASAITKSGPIAGPSSSSTHTSSSSLNAPQPAKARASTGLLPGKSRPPAKPTAKPDPLKQEPPKSASATGSPGSLQPKFEAAKSRAAQSSPPAAAGLAKANKIKKAEPPPKTEASQPSQSKFAALMAEIAEPKKVKPPTPTPTPTPDIDETDEERERRLRKEGRRRLNLHVNWKSDDELVSVHVFHKEASEDEGREDNMIRDAGDDQAEGKLLKQSRAGVLHPWEELASVDSNHTKKEAWGEHWQARGGSKTAHTDEQKVMEDKENTELMVVYTDPADIPSSSKSPPPCEPASSDGGIVVYPPDTPFFREMALRDHETKTLPFEESQRRRFERLRLKEEAEKEAAKYPNKSEEIIAKTRELAKKISEDMTQQDREQHVFLALTSDAVKQWQDPEPYDPNNPKTVRRNDYADPEVQKAADAIEDVVAQFKDKPAIQQSPPEWMQDPHRIAEWWKGYNADKQRKEEQERQEAAQKVASQPAHTPFSALFGHLPTPGAQPYAQLAPLPQQAQIAYGYPSTVPPPAPATSAQQAVADPQVNAILASLPSLTQQQAPQQAPSLPPAATAEDTRQFQALLATIGSNQSQQAQNVPSAPEAAAAITLPQDPNDAYLLLAHWAANQGQSPQSLALGHDQSLGQAQAQAYGQSHDQGYGHGYHSGPSQGYGHDYQQHQHRDRDDHDAGGPSRSSGNGGNRGRDKGSGHGARRGGGGGGQGEVPDHLRGINRNLIGTKQCTFWARGQCAKGDKCTFRHD